MRRVLLWGAGITVLFGIVVFVALSRIDSDFVLKQIAEISRQTTGQAVLCEKMPEISFFPPGLTLSKATWGAMPSKGQGMAVTIKSATVVLELWPLLSGNVAVKEIRLENPVFEMRQGQLDREQGDNTETSSADSRKDASPKTSAPSTASALPADLPAELDRLVLHQGEIIVEAHDKQRFHAQNINLTIENLRRRQDASIRCDLAFDFGKDKKENISGTVALGTKLRYEESALVLRQFDFTFTPLGGRIPKETGPVQFTFNGAFNPPRNELTLSDLRLTLPYNLKVQGDMELRASSPLSLKGKIQAGDVFVDKYLVLLKQVSPAPVGNSPKPADKAPSADKRVETPMAAKGNEALPSVDLHISVAGIHNGKLTLKDISIDIKGNNGKYALNPVNCVLGSGGSVSAQADVNLPGKFYATKIKAKGVNIGGMLDALNKGRPAEGAADLNADINIRGSSAKEFMSSLNGEGILEARDVRVAALSSLPKTIPGASTLSDRFQLIRIPFTARNGEVTAQPVTATSKDIDAKGRALASLPREFLDATATVHALGLNIPIYAKGPFSNLSYGLDAKFTLPGLPNAAGSLEKTGKAAGDTLKKGTKGAGGLVKGLLGR